MGIVPIIRQEETHMHDHSTDRLSKKLTAFAVALMTVFGAGSPAFRSDSFTPLTITACADESTDPVCGSGTFEYKGNVFTYECYERAYNNSRYVNKYVRLNSVEVNETLLEIPSTFTIDGRNYTVDYLGDNFAKASIAETVILPDTVKTIGYGFLESSKAITLKGNCPQLTSIGGGFGYSSPLTSIELDAPKLAYLGCYSLWCTPYMDNHTEEQPVVFANMLVKYKGKDKAVKIADLSETPIYAIATDALCGLSETESLDLTGVRYIGDGCIMSCKKLSEITGTDDLEYIGTNAFLDSPWLNAKENEKEIILGKTLFRYTVKNGRADFSDAKYDKLVYICQNAFTGDEIKELRCNTGTQMLWSENVSQTLFKSLENLIVDGNIVQCRNIEDYVPKIIDDNYRLIIDTPFEQKYIDDKVKLIIEATGHTYYGIKNDKKGTLDPAEEFQIILDINDYMSTNYNYRSEVNSFGQILLTDRGMVCEPYATVTAYLLESAGVDAEIVGSNVPDPENPGEMYNGNHAWNIVRIGDTFFQLDDCWNSTDHDNNAEIEYHWFLDSDARVHKEEAAHKYWKIGYTDWVTCDYKETPVCPYTLGDANGDDWRDETDLHILENYIRIKNEDGIVLNNCDINFDGKVDETDLEYLYHFLHEKSADKNPHTGPSEPEKAPDYIDEPEPASSEEDITTGDVNSDGKINSADITKTAAHIKGLKKLTDEEKKRADTNTDNRIDSSDIMRIAAHIKGLKKLK